MRDHDVGGKPPRENSDLPLVLERQATFDAFPASEFAQPSVLAPAADRSFGADMAGDARLSSSARSGAPPALQAERAEHGVWHFMGDLPSEEAEAGHPPVTAAAFEELVQDCTAMGSGARDGVREDYLRRDDIRPRFHDDIDRQGFAGPDPEDPDSECDESSDFEEQQLADLGLCIVDSYSDQMSTGSSWEPRHESGRSPSNLTELKSRAAADDSGSSSPAHGSKCCRRPRHLKKAVRDCPHCCAYCPLTGCAISFLMLFVLAGFAWPGMTVNTDFGSFLEVDGETAEALLAFDVARASLGRPPPLQASLTTAAPPDKAAQAGYKSYTFRIVYTDKTGRGAYSDDVLQAMRKFEKNLVQQPWWRKMCEGSPRHSWMCDPGLSAVNLVWAQREESEDNRPQNIPTKVNGMGYEALPLDVAFAMSRSRATNGLLFPRGFEVGQVAANLRSIFIFHIPFCNRDISPECVGPSAGEADPLYKDFIAQDLTPFFNKARDLFDGDIEQPMTIAWGGSGVSSSAVETALYRDVLMVLGAAIFIILYISWHAGSCFVSFASLFMTILGLPFAFVTLAQMSGSNELGGVAFAALGLIIGVGADIILVFESVWNCSLKVFDKKDIVARMKYVNKQAAVACFFTSATTACSFFANLLSALRPLREFGCFMGLCIMWTYAILCLSLPAILLIRERCSCKDSSGTCCVRVVGRDQIHRAMGGKLGNFNCKRITGSGFLQAYVHRVVVPFSRSICVFFVLLPVGLGYWASQVVEVGNSVEQFPENHNENRMDAVERVFDYGGVPVASTDTMICNVGREAVVSDDGRDLCGVHWCIIAANIGEEVKILGETATSGGHSQCVCMPTSVPAMNCRDSDGDGLKAASVTTRFIGQPFLPQDYWESEEWRGHIEEVVLSAHPEADIDPTLQLDNFTMTFHTLVQMHWESGSTYLQHFSVAPMARMLVSSGSGKVCDLDELCYCGAPKCLLWEEREASIRAGQDPKTVPASSYSTVRGPPLDAPFVDIAPASTTTTTELTLESDGPNSTDAADFVAPPFALQTTPTPPPPLASGNAEVNMVWGIQINEGVAPLLGKRSEHLWSFDPEFFPEAPTVQRHAIEICENIRAIPALQVVRDYCWMEEYRDWLRDRGGLFPARGVDFNPQLLEFLDFGMADDRSIAGMVWYADRERLGAFYYAFVLNLETSVLGGKAAWDDFIKISNLNAPVGMDKAWVASDAFYKAEAMDYIIRSTIDSMILSAACGFLGALCSTQGDIVLSLFALFSVIAVIICLAWVIAVVAQWPIGAFEVLGLIIFVGYSITYAIHILHKYQEHLRDLQHIEDPKERRREAVTQCLQVMAGAIMGSAMTTLGSSAFLLLCLLVVFVKIAGILVAVAALSSIYALVALPTALLVIGPSEPWGLFSLRTRLAMVVSSCCGRRHGAVLEPTIAL